MIAGHYLIVQRWRPFFLTTENHVRKIAAWIRIPNLPIKLYNHHFLWRVGSTIRHMLKIDRATSIHSRGKFARICVKIDLSKKLVPRISILGSTLNIEYEGLHLIYFSCEKYGYKVEQCSEAGEHKLDQLVVEMAGEEERATAARRRADVSTGEVDRETPANQERIDDHIVQRINKNPPDFGPWMMVRRNQRRKQEEIPRKNKKQIQISNVMPNKETNGSMKNTFNEGGSRFNALYEERDNEMQDNLQPKEAMQSGSKLANSNQALKKNLSHKGLDCPKPINQAPDRALVSTLPRSNRSNIGPLNQTRNQLNKEEGAKVVLRKPGAGRNPQGPQKTAALKIGPMLTKKGFKPKQKMMDKGSLSLWAAIHSMDNAVSSSSKSTDREIMEGVILDRMREKILRRGTPVLTVEDGDGRWAPSEQPGTIKEGNKNSTKGKEPMFHAKASEDMEGSAWRAAPSPSSEAWNCREAGGKGFSTLIRDLRKDLDVNFVILMEIHISGVRGERVRNRFGLNGSFVMEARGQSGGASIQHLPNLRSDHSPLFLCLAPQASPNKGRRPFRFLAAWLDHSDFDNVVNRGWNLQGNWNSCMEDFQQVLQNWNHNVFGNIHRRKSKILRRLQGIKNSLNMTRTSIWRNCKGISGRSMRRSWPKRNFSGTKNLVVIG
ncbi:uncharacterized protein [Arachis hypogaea]|uniref:uncharacterized protein n=1 Tax=Arachis hypogaea TaxID=3818 RepID=UPI001105748A|nr:uncharacterized protein LOC112756692 [Arachis hypogaea]